MNVGKKQDAFDLIIIRNEGGGGDRERGGQRDWEIGGGFIYSWVLLSNQMD